MGAQMPSSLDFLPQDIFMTLSFASVKFLLTSHTHTGVYAHTHAHTPSSHSQHPIPCSIDSFIPNSTNLLLFILCCLCTPPIPAWSSLVPCLASPGGTLWGRGLGCSAWLCLWPWMASRLTPSTFPTPQAAASFPGPSPLRAAAPLLACWHWRKLRLAPRAG